MSGAVKLAVFDCDGTLVDGQAEICVTMVEAFEQLGLPAPSRNEILRSVGLSLPFAMERLYPEGDRDLHVALSDAYKAAFRAARASGRIGEPLFPGVRWLLDALRADGWELGVATGKSDRGLAHCLAAHGLSQHFITLQTADRHPSKPHPAMVEAAMAEAMALPADTVMIGDTVFDIVAGVNAGVRCFGVAWGYHPAEELIEAGALAVANTAEELREMLR